jgi:hypothetical protein
VTSSRIWPATNGPSNEDNSDPVTLGTRFTLSTSGWVTHLHYWRGTVNDTGSHAAAIFKVSDSSLVAGTSVTLPAVGTGWQTGQLATPVQLTPGVTYVVAVLHPDGHPAFTGGYWASGGPGFGGITNGILTAPDSPTVGGQGVFSGGSSLQCPTNTFGGNNYWSDVTVTDTDPGTLTDSGADTITLTDAVATAVDYARSPADTIALTDGVQIVLDLNRAVGDTIGLTDTATAALDLGRTQADVIGLTDQAVATVDFGRQPSDLIALTDAATAALDAQRSPADSILLTDQASPTLDASRGVADVIGLTDTVTAVLTQAGADWDFALGPPYTNWSVGPPHV